MKRNGYAVVIEQKDKTFTELPCRTEEIAREVFRVAKRKFRGYRQIEAVSYVPGEQGTFLNTEWN